MLLLLSNDDGVHAPGLRALAGGLEAMAECWVVAPADEQSAGSHALSLHRPMRAQPLSERRIAVQGTPADCVYLGLQHFLPRRPDAVVCGINRGANVSLDVYYSGTVAAAREAVMWGIPALSVSLFTDGGGGGSTVEHWDSAVHYACRVAELHRRGLQPEQLLNLNVPNLPLDAIRGLRVARLGRRNWSRIVDARHDIKGRPYYWIGGHHQGFDDITDSDGPSVQQGWATITPLKLDCTDLGALEALARWDAVREDS
jgi:5'-nucleotidase